MTASVRVIAVLMAASIAVPLAAWRLAFLRLAPLRFWASHPWITAVAFCLTVPVIPLALASPRSALMVAALLAALAVEFLVITVSVVHGLRLAWKRSGRQAALTIAALLLTGILIAGVNPGAAGVFWWMVAVTAAFVGWCVLMAIGAAFLERRYPE